MRKFALCFTVNETETEVGAGTETVTDAPPRGRSCFVGEGESYDSIEGEMKACKFLEVGIVALQRIYARVPWNTNSVACYVYVQLCIVQLCKIGL